MNFKDFLSSIKNRGGEGLIIIFPEEKMNNVRNNMIRAANDKFCVKSLENAIIFPVLKDSETPNEITKVFSVKAYPFYIFCKYKFYN